MSRKLFLSFIFVFTFITAGVANACDSCGCTLAHNAMETQPCADKPWFFNFTFEQQNWNEMDARQAHTLHHQGHDFHDKTHEDFYHFSLGVHPVETLTILADLPYVSKGSINVESHAALGRRETSEGLGDLNLNATWFFFEKERISLGATGGAKFPTGATKETDSTGTRFEPELQPGTGSFDYSLGAAFGYDGGVFRVDGNAMYTVKTEGDQDFEEGDVFALHALIDTSLNAQARIGVDTNWQFEAKETEAGVKVDDSGGVTLLMGPALTIDAADNISLFGNFMVPVYQNLGGVHQELDFAWNAGAKVSW